MCGMIPLSEMNTDQFTLLTGKKILHAGNEEVHGSKREER